MTTGTALPFPLLDLHVLRRPSQTIAAQPTQLRQRRISSLKINPGTPTAFSVAFDDLQARLAVLPRMFLELDGSFMWAGTSHGGLPWRLDGMIYENGRTVQWMELKGQCPLPAWDQLLEICGHATDPMMVLWLPEQCFLEVPQVRRFWTEGQHDT